MAPLKILACGSVDGNFSKFLKRVSSIHKKNGPFEMVLCSGDFFIHNTECKSNWKTFIKTVKCEVPVYILGPTSKELEQFYAKDKLHDGEEMCENILYLGRKGIFKTASGLVVAYISGREKLLPGGDFNESDINALKDQIRRDDKFQGVDILLTSVWPQGITKYTKTEMVENNPSILLSSLCTSIKPRYHITCHKDSFFERLPYRNHQVLQQEQQHVTRFISLAPFNNPSKEKAVYAFSITPMSQLPREDLIKQPDDATEFPYKNVLMKKEEASNNDNQFFFSKDDIRKRKSDANEDRRRKNPKGPPALSSACWFCLGSKDVEKHLVVSVGEQCYLAIAKGALNDDHVLICPVSHHNSAVVLPDEVRLEMEKYKDGLRKMFEKEKKVMVTYERNFYTQHLQLQVYGLPKSLTDDIKDTFQDFADNVGMEMIDIPEEKDISEMVAITTPYFAVETPGGRLLHKVKGRMPLQFGRDVLASPSLLSLPDRVDWRNCKLSKEEEVITTKSFRKRFQPFDFNFN